MEEPPSSGWKGIVQIYNDPAVTMTIGSSTDTENPVTVGADIEFYVMKNDQLTDLSQHNATLPLTHLTTGMVHLMLKMTNLSPLVVEAKDMKAIQFVELGIHIQMELEPKLDGANVVVKAVKLTGSAEVDINADKPFENCCSKAIRVDDALQQLKKQQLMLQQ